MDCFNRRAIEGGFKVLLSFPAVNTIENFAKTFAGRIGFGQTNIKLQDFRTTEMVTFEDLRHTVEMLQTTLTFVWDDKLQVLEIGFRPLVLALKDHNVVSLRAMFEAKPFFVRDFLERVYGNLFSHLRDGTRPFESAEVVRQITIDATVHLGSVHTEWTFYIGPPQAVKRERTDGAAGQPELSRRALKKLKAAGGAPDSGRGGGGGRGDGGRGGGGRGGGGRGGRGNGGRGNGGGGGAGPAGLAPIPGSLCAHHLAHLLVPTKYKDCTFTNCRFEHAALAAPVTQPDKDKYSNCISTVIRDENRKKVLLTRVAEL